MDLVGGGLTPRSRKNRVYVGLEEGGQLCHRFATNRIRGLRVCLMLTASSGRDTLKGADDLSGNSLIYLSCVVSVDRILASKQTFNFDGENAFDIVAYAGVDIEEIR